MNRRLAYRVSAIARGLSCWARGLRCTHTWPVALALLALESFVVPVAAQGLNKQAYYLLVAPGTYVPNPTGPFRFRAFISFNLTSAKFTNNFTLPDGSTRTIPNTGSGGWLYDDVFNSAAEMEAAFPSGTYQVTFGGNAPISIPFPGDLVPNRAAPVFSQGAFRDDGVYIVDRTQPLTVTIAFTEKYLAGYSLLGIRVFDAVNGQIYFQVDNSDSNYTQTPLSFTVPANFFQPSQIYTLGLQVTRFASRASLPASIGAGEAQAQYLNSVQIAIITGTPPQPSFTRQPVAQTVAVGSTVVLTAAASGATSYQWRKDSVAISDATSSTLVIRNAAIADTGSYSVEAINGATRVASTGARLTVTNRANFGHLTNLSIRASLSAAESSFTLGTVIGGAPGTKPLLVRAVGPSLAQFGIAGAIPAAKLDLLAGASVMASNDGWGGGAAMSDAFASVGAFALASASSRDSAIFNPAIAARDYTVRVSASGNATGEVLAELYDAGPAATFDASVPRLVNVSVRKTIAVGETLTAGFVIAGDTARTVLVRAIGPGLAAFGVGGTMPDPQLALFSGATKIAENDDWGGDAQLTTIGTSVGAFSIADARSRDAMLLLTLAPGSYTAQVKGSLAGGQALLEVYEVP